MLSRVARLLLVGALVAGATTACTPEPEPTPTAGFATEEEAFAAAEETYRAYVDALNQVDLSDPATFEEVYAWTTGELNASDRASFSAWHAEGFEILGASRVLRVQPADIAWPAVRIEACYDVSEVDVLDANGVSIVGADRPDVQRLRVSLVESESTATHLAIDDIVPSEDELSC